MDEYELMLIALVIAGSIAWKFFAYIAKFAIWSDKPKLNQFLYAMIVVNLALELGVAFEWWEAALLIAISITALSHCKSERKRFEETLQEIAAKAQEFSLRGY